jgi:DNA-directed RNA polymerase subunit A'
MSKSTIAGIQFILRDAKQIEDHSTVAITSYDMYTNNLPTPGGVFDPRLGTTLRTLQCPICKNNKGKCLGHIGRINLTYPVVNPFGVKDYKKWLKVICHKCGGSVASPAAVVGDKLTTMAAATRTKNRRCQHCTAAHPILKQNEDEKLMLEATFLRDNGTLESRHKIYPHMAHEIFSRVTPETVISYGKRPDSHPLTTVLYMVTAPSNVIRPDVRQTGDDRNSTNSITNIMIVLLKKNAEFPAPIPDEIPETLEKRIWDFNNLYYEMIRAGGKETVSISGQFKGKPGRFRGCILGKQVRRMGRSTIIGDPTLRLDEVRIPQKFARTVSIEETVQDYNRAALMILLQNGPNRYPGACAIVKKTGGLFDVSATTDFTSLENGDVVRRHVLDGDYVYFNRQPSLMPSNLSGMRVVVSRDAEDLTIGMNVNICPLFNADFDGDAMNLVFASNPAGMSEVEIMGWLGNNIIHFSTAKMLTGQAQDSVIGLAELTRESVRLDKYHACMLFARSLEMPALARLFPGKDSTISGRECVSLIIQKTPVNVSCPAMWFNQSYIPMVKYIPGEINTVIRHGKLVSGVLDKATIGQGAANSLYQIIANDHGNQKSIQAIYDMQQMAIHFMKMRGYTVSVQDIIIPEEARQKIHVVSSEALSRSALIVERLMDGKIVPPMGVTVRDHYEVMQINALTTYDAYIDILLQYINHDENNLFKLAAFGSKGNINNMANIVSALGQKVIDGRRMPKKFGFERTLPCFRRFDLSPEANGYVPNSYIVGLNPAEMAFAGMCSRLALIIKALASSVGGQMSRDAIKCMESMYIDYFRRLMQGQKIVAFAYGGDNLDPRKVESLKLATVVMSESAFRENYLYDKLPNEFTVLREDREKYRRAI